LVAVIATVVELENAGTEMEPPAGGVESLVRVRVVLAVLPAVSRPVTVSVGELEVPALQENAFETYGPPYASSRWRSRRARPSGWRRDRSSRPPRRW
jgi:hypothetical protein